MTEAPPVKSAQRLVELVECLAETPDGATFTELLASTGLPKSSLHGLLATLHAHGWVDLDEPSRRYRLGIRLWRLSQRVPRFDLLAHLAQRHLVTIRDELNETVQLSVLDGLDNVYIAKVDSEHPLRLVSTVGARLPASATALGKVLLAHLEPEEFARRIADQPLTRFTDQTITDVATLETDLRGIRKKGYGEDDGEYTPGVHCLAVPVRGRGGAVVAAMSCTVPTARFDDSASWRRRLLSVLTRNAEALSAELDDF